MQKFTTIKPLNQNNMGKTREKLLNANRYCHIYVDDDGITNYHDTETNETYRVIPDTGALGFYLEYFKDGVLNLGQIHFQQPKDVLTKEMILEYLKKWGKCKRDKIDNLIVPKLSAVLNENQKKKKVTNFLSALKSEGKIVCYPGYLWDVV